MTDIDLWHLCQGAIPKWVRLDDGTVLTGWPLRRWLDTRPAEAA